MESQQAKAANRAILITGAGRRLGRAMADQLAREGWHVVLHVHTATAEAEAHCAALNRQGLRASWVCGDLSQPAAADGVFDAALAHTGTLHALINNAASFSLQPTLAAADAAALWQLNVESPKRLTERLYRQLSTSSGERPGCVINLLDQRIADAADTTPYTLTKRALADFTCQEARRFAPTLRLMGLAPGALLAPPDPATAEPAGAFPLGFRPTPHDLATTVSFVLNADFLTGQVFYVDSGQHLLRKTRTIES